MVRAGSTLIWAHFLTVDIDSPTYVLLSNKKASKYFLALRHHCMPGNIWIQTVTDSTLAIARSCCYNAVKRCLEWL